MGGHEEEKHESGACYSQIFTTIQPFILQRVIIRRTSCQPSFLVHLRPYYDTRNMTFFNAQFVI